VTAMKNKDKTVSYGAHWKKTMSGNIQVSIKDGKKVIASAKVSQDKKRIDSSGNALIVQELFRNLEDSKKVLGPINISKQK